MILEQQEKQRQGGEHVSSEMQARPASARRDIGRAGKIRAELALLGQAIHIRLGMARVAQRLLPEFALVPLRTALYRWAGCDIRRGAAVQGDLRLVGTGPTASRLHVAEGVIIAPNSVFGLDASIHIGQNAAIGPNCLIYTGSHPVGFGSRRMSFKMTPHPVSIGKGAWIGMGSLILPGVTIGDGSIVAAGSVVAEDVPPNVFVSGNPALVREDLPFGNR